MRKPCEKKKEWLGKLFPFDECERVRAHLTYSQSKLDGCFNKHY